jgi:hypothetical protein
MGRAKKPRKPRGNRGNIIKNLKVIQKNLEIINTIKNETIHRGEA